jgi:hypothetical protein
MPTQLQLWHFVDVAIGLTFCYLSLGLMASTFKELVSGWLNWRGKRLREALKDLLEHGAVGTGQTLFAAVFRHGLICPDAHDRAPSYIASRNFAAALTSALVQSPGPQPLLDQLAASIAGLPDGRVRSSLQALLTQARATWTSSTPGSNAGSTTRWTGSRARTSVSAATSCSASA